MWVSDGEHAQHTLTAARGALTRQVPALAGQEATPRLSHSVMSLSAYQITPRGRSRYNILTNQTNQRAGLTVTCSCDTIRSNVLAICAIDTLRARGPRSDSNR